MTDEQLVARSQAGDRAATNAVMARYERAALWVAAQFFDYTSEREDVQQEARLGMFKAVRDYQPSLGGFNRFAFLCCRRQVITFVKTSKRGKHDVLTYASRVATNDEGDEIASVDAVEDRDADTVWLLQRRARVQAAAAVVQTGLSKLERAVLEGIANGETQVALQRRLGYPMSSWPDGRPRAKVVENAWQRAQLKLGRALAEADSVPLGRAA